MRKIVSFFAFVAIVLTFAACGGNSNEPEVKDFTITVNPLSRKAHFIVKANDPDAYFFWRNRPYHIGDENQLSYYTGMYVYPAGETFEGQIKEGKIVQGIKDDIVEVYKDDQYILWACRVEETEGGRIKIVGGYQYAIYKTMPEYTLNGAFSVSDTKTVHFAQSNTWQASSGKYSYDEQWACEHKTSGYPFDLMAWSSINFLDQPFYVPSADEWYYLFKGRNNAIDLCAHATVNGTPGLIILPDNWEKPSNIKLKTDGELGFVWKGIDNWYIQQDANFNGYEKNKFTKEDWQTLEFAGAVFLPAAGSDDSMIGYGDYWSSSSASNTNNAYYLEFSKYAIDLSYLKKNPLPKSSKLSIRPVRVVE